MAGPVIADGRVFVRDGEAGVTAFDAASGAERWSIDLTPEIEDSDEGYGGGLAYADGTLFVTTGFGQLVALDPASGQVKWEHVADAPYRAGPAARAGVVIAIDRSDKAQAYDAATGEIRWTIQSGIAGRSALGGGSPAIFTDVSALPFGSGELMLVRTGPGFMMWTGTLVSRGTVDGLKAFTDVTSDPALASGPSIIAGNAGGALAMFDGRSGQRVWQRDFGSLTPVWVAGDTLYAVTTQPAVTRLDVATGETLWRTPLQAWEDPEDEEDPIAYAGPVLAGDQVLVTSSDGRLLTFDAQTGAAGAVAEMSGGSRSGPAVAGGTVYVLTDEGDLLAYR